MLDDSTIRAVQEVLTRVGRPLSVKELLAEFPESERRTVHRSLALMIQPGYIEVTRDLKVKAPT